MDLEIDEGEWVWVLVGEIAQNECVQKHVRFKFIIVH